MADVSSLRRHFHRSVHYSISVDRAAALFRGHRTTTAARFAALVARDAPLQEALRAYLRRQGVFRQEASNRNLNGGAANDVATECWSGLFSETTVETPSVFLVEQLADAKIVTLDAEDHWPLLRSSSSFRVGVGADSPTAAALANVAQRGSRLVMLQGFSGEGGGELSAPQHAVVEVLEDITGKDEWLLVRSCDEDRRGYVPAAFLGLLHNSEIASSSNSGEGGVGANTVFMAADATQPPPAGTASEPSVSQPRALAEPVYTTSWHSLFAVLGVFSGEALLRPMLGSVRQACAEVIGWSCFGDHPACPAWRSSTAYPQQQPQQPCTCPSAPPGAIAVAPGQFVLIMPDQTEAPPGALFVFHAELLPEGEAVIDAALTSPPCRSDVEHGETSGISPSLEALANDEAVLKSIHAALFSARQRGDCSTWHPQAGYLPAKSLLSGRNSVSARAVYPAATPSAAAAVIPPSGSISSSALLIPPSASTSSSALRSGAAVSPTAVASASPPASRVLRLDSLWAERSALTRRIQHLDQSLAAEWLEGEERALREQQQALLGRHRQSAHNTIIETPACRLRPTGVDTSAIEQLQRGVFSPRPSSLSAGTPAADTSSSSSALRFRTPQRGTPVDPHDDTTSTPFIAAAVTRETGRLHAITPRGPSSSVAASAAGGYDGGAGDRRAMLSSMRKCAQEECEKTSTALLREARACVTKSRMHAAARSAARVSMTVLLARQGGGR